MKLDEETAKMIYDASVKPMKIGNSLQVAEFRAEMKNRKIS